VVDDMVQAVDELACNTIVHGYRGRAGSIEVEVWREGSRLAVRLRDQAPPFDPATAPAPNLALPLEQRRPGGLGIAMSRQLTDAISHRVMPDGGNELTLFKEAF
jgi:serine/threonine-protein kinase RsbW